MHPVSEASMEVNLEDVSDREFRLFENHHFNFVSASSGQNDT